jgi:hypothetical protein
VSTNVRSSRRTSKASRSRAPDPVRSKPHTRAGSAKHFSERATPTAKAKASNKRKRKSVAMCDSGKSAKAVERVRKTRTTQSGCYVRKPEERRERTRRGERSAEIAKQYRVERGLKCAARHNSAGRTRAQTFSLCRAVGRYGRSRLHTDASDVKVVRVPSSRAGRSRSHSGSDLSEVSYASSRGTRASRSFRPDRAQLQLVAMRERRSKRLDLPAPGVLDF